MTSEKAWEIALANKGLIFKHLSTYYPKLKAIYSESVMSFNDYAEIGMITLYNCALSHNPEASEFSTYAYRSLISEWNRFGQNEGYKFRRVPSYVYTRNRKKISEAETEEEFKNGVEEFREIIGRSEGLVDENHFTCDSSQIKELEDNQFCNDIINMLSDKEKSIIKMYYGIGFRKRRIDDIARLMRISIASVRRIRDSAILKLKQIVKWEGVCNEEQPEKKSASMV